MHVTVVCHEVRVKQSLYLAAVMGILWPRSRKGDEMRITGSVVIGLTLVAACAPEGAQNTVPASDIRPFSLVEASISDVQAAIDDGRETCHSLVEESLARIAAYDETTGLHAITVLNPKALIRADEMDADLAAGKRLGPLYCVPVVVKDNFDTADMITSGGSIALKTSIPPDDAFMVRKLRQADAIIIAKTNMAEWAFSPRETISSSFGTTANAYDLGRVPAGSSGGTASAVAASFAVAGLGSDTGNSIRGPSSHLALVGIRSTMGLTSRDGVIPLIADRDIAGPMARSVEDVARMFNVVAGYDPADPITELGKGKRSADYTQFLDANALKGARLGVLREFVEHEDSDPEVLALFEAALDDLRAAGAEIIDPFIVPNMDAHSNADNFCASFRYDMHEYLKTLGDTAPITDVKEALDGDLYGPDAKGGLEELTTFPVDRAPEDWDEPCQRFQTNTERTAYRADVTNAMDEHSVDALLYPTWSNPPAHIDKGREEYKGDNSQNLAPSTGLPAITVPMGYSHGNLPAGLQIVSRAYDEGTLFALAYSYEQTTHHRRPPEGFPALEE